jgi:aryl-alcohol dehydrogenase-like predicted oxidoreductase
MDLQSSAEKDALIAADYSVFVDAAGAWLLQIPSATLESKVFESVDVLRELVRLRVNGLVIGLTVTGPNQPRIIREALQVRVDGVNPFQVVQATWNLLEPSAATALEEAKAAGWSVIVKEAPNRGPTSRYRVR